MTKASHKKESAEAAAFLVRNMLQCRAAIGLQITTGLKHSRGSILRHCQAMGYTDKRTLRGAYADLDAKLVELGAESRPLRES